MESEIKIAFPMKIAKAVWELISSPDDDELPIALGQEETLKRLHAVKLSLQNHKETVKQNQSLQKSLNELKERPFFPYPLNSGNRQDYGEFYLISHAWFSFLNTSQQIGIVEVEYKHDKHRAMYIGITHAVPTPEGFRASVLCIAQYGQKIRDSREV